MLNVVDRCVLAFPMPVCQRRMDGNAYADGPPGQINIGSIWGRRIEKGKIQAAEEDEAVTI